MQNHYLDGTVRFHNSFRERKRILNADRISDLPDMLMVKVLSSLDMKDAVRTSVLSRKWEDKWIETENISFECDDEEVSEQFLSFVNNVLMRCTCPKVEIFSLKFECIKIDISERILRWLEFVMSKKVRILKLGKELYCKLPGTFYSSPSFVELEIEGVYDSSDTFIMSGENIQWPCLQNLSLKLVYLEEEVVAKILLGSPLLESLIMDEVRGVRSLTITSGLKMLKLRNFQFDEASTGSVLKINAPHIQELQIEGRSVDVTYELVDVSSLTYARLMFNYSCVCEEVQDSDVIWHSLVDNVLKRVCHVDELVLGSDIIHAMSLSEILGDNNLPIFKCKILTIHSPQKFRIYEIPGIKCLLQRMPHLETLFLEISPIIFSDSQDFLHVPFWQDEFNMHYAQHFTFDGIDYLNLQVENFRHLKNVKIDYAEHVYPGTYDEHFDFEIIGYLLKNAPVLEKMIVLPPKSNSAQWPKDIATEYSTMMSDESMVGNKAAKWDLTRNEYLLEFNFSKDFAQ